MRTQIWTALGAALLGAGLVACAGEEMPATADTLELGTQPAAGAAAAEVGTVLNVAQTQQYGPHLVDATGRALYLLEADSAGTSTCYDACAEAWPPLLAPQQAPTAGDPAVQAGLIGTIQRRDGATQVTYGGHPLYYYERDQGAGQATGQDVTDQWGEWYLVTPKGQHLEHQGGSGGS